MEYRKGIIAIIIDEENKFLILNLQSYKPDEWNFLGGGKEGNESEEENVIREIKEEIGINESDFEIIKKSGINLKYDFPKSIEKDGKTYIGQEKVPFLVKFTGDKSSLKILKDEVRKIKWVKYNELNKYFKFPNQFEDLSGIIEDLDLLGIRILDRLYQQIMIADELMQLTEKIDNFWEEHKATVNKNFKLINSNEAKSLKILQHLFFSNSLIRLTTLFSKRNNIEVNFLYYFEQTQSKNDEFDKLQKDFNDSNLKKFRDKFIAHLDIDINEDPAARYSNFIRTEHISTMRIYINALYSILKDTCPEIIGKGSFVYIDRSLSIVIKELMGKILAFENSSKNSNCD